MHILPIPKISKLQHCYFSFNQKENKKKNRSSTIPSLDALLAVAFPVTIILFTYILTLTIIREKKLRKRCISLVKEFLVYSIFQFKLAKNFLFLSFLIIFLNKNLSLFSSLPSFYFNFLPSFFPSSSSFPFSYNKKSFFILHFFFD